MFFFILHFFCIFMQFNQSEHFFVMNSIKSASTIEWICYKIAPANNHFEYFCIASEMKTNNCQDRNIILWFPFPRKKTMVIFVVYITCWKTLFNLHCIELRRLTVHFLSGWTYFLFYLFATHNKIHNKQELCHKSRDFKHSLLIYSQKEK